ncbi:MAG: TetR family transcriptional regulator [Actinomycetota bacterium]|nr:TetR family transcriptional regulator [Actinomycetota bacterium]
MPGERSTPRHDRESVINAAIELLDEHGLPELTMRRLAAVLDVQPSALYWHVENKQTLLAAIADRILGHARPSPAPQVSWREATAAEATTIRDALLAYRDGAEVVLSTRALGLGAEDAHARLVSALRRGHDAETSELAATALLHLVLGDASLVQQRLQADSLGVVSPESSLGSITQPPADEAFRLGVELLLSGLDFRIRSGLVRREVLAGPSA